MGAGVADISKDLRREGLEKKRLLFEQKGSRLPIHGKLTAFPTAPATNVTVINILYIISPTITK